MLRVVVLMAAVSSASSCEAECERAFRQSLFACCTVSDNAYYPCSDDAAPRPAGRSGPPPPECPAGCQDNLDNMASACECMSDAGGVKHAADRLGCDDPTAVSTGAIVGIVATVVVVVIVVCARLYDDDGLATQTQPSSTVEPGPPAGADTAHRPHGSARRAAPERAQAQVRAEPKGAPGTLEELAAMAQIGMDSISAFTEPDFDELTAGLGIDVGPRIVLRTQFRELKRGAGPVPEPELESLPPGSVP